MLFEQQKQQQPRARLIRNFVWSPDRLHARLWKELPFVRHGDRPRSECWMDMVGMPYTYGRGEGTKTYASSPWHRDVMDIRDQIGWDLRLHATSCFTNGYRDGRDHLGWHSDDSPEMDDAAPIVVVSLGAERELWLRPKDQKGEATERFVLSSGSALIMPPGMQDTHAHRVPKCDRECGPRISLTFRSMVYGTMERGTYKRMGQKLIRRLGHHNHPVLSHWCPGCMRLHDFAVEVPFDEHVQWAYNADPQRPSFYPSMSIQVGPPDDREVCHYFLEDGRIDFLWDCTHELRRIRKIELPDIPPEALAGLREIT